MYQGKLPSGGSELPGAFSCCHSRSQPGTRNCLLLGMLLSRTFRFNTSFSPGQILYVSVLNDVIGFILSHASLVPLFVVDGSAGSDRSTSLAFPTAAGPKLRAYRPVALRKKSQLHRVRTMLSVIKTSFKKYPS